MASLIRKKTSLEHTQPSSGQALIEFVVALPIYGLLTLAAMLLVKGVFASTFLSIDLYQLARAHLYGQNLHQCQPSQHWPQSAYLQVNFHCEDRTHYQEKLQIIWRNKPIIHVKREIHMGPLN